MESRSFEDNASSSCCATRYSPGKRFRLRHQPIAELRTEFAAPIALETIARVIGLPDEQDAELRQWYDVFAELFEPVTADRTELVRKCARRTAIQSPAHGHPAAHVRAACRR